MTFDLKDLKERILDELKDATMYMKKAIENKGTKWGSYFCQMSKNELEHANILLKMFNEMDTPDGVTDAAHKEMYAAIMDSYISSMTSIEGMKKLYWGD